MIHIKSPQEIKIMAEGGRILATVLQEIEKMVVPGITTKELDKAAKDLIVSRGAKPAFLGYEGFPYTLCASVNSTVVHGLPTDTPLKEGDIAGLDLGVLYQGYYADSAITVAVGNISFQAKHLIETTKKALKLGIKKTRAGVTVGDIGNTIQRHVESQGYGVVRSLFGHGIGKELHEDPYVPNFGKRHKGIALQEGMVICIEPMVTVGNYEVTRAKDGFGFITKDGSLTAHFEHTLAITKDGCRVLTEI